MSLLSRHASQTLMAVLRACLEISALVSCMALVR